MPENQAEQEQVQKYLNLATTIGDRVYRKLLPVVELGNILLQMLDANNKVTEIRKQQQIIPSPPPVAPVAPT